MPLNSQHLPEGTVRNLDEIPIDSEANQYSDVPYQTKTEIYDKKCSGCGFARIIVRFYNKAFVFNSIDKALTFALSKVKTPHIERSCSYPADVIKLNNTHRYPSLSEIVKNGCSFWNPKMIPSPDEATEFNEISIFQLSEKIKKMEIIGEPDAISRII